MKYNTPYKTNSKNKWIVHPLHQLLHSQPMTAQKQKGLRFDYSRIQNNQNIHSAISIHLATKCTNICASTMHVILFFVITFKKHHICCWNQFLVTIRSVPIFTFGNTVPLVHCQYIYIYIYTLLLENKPG